MKLCDEKGSDDDDDDEAEIWKRFEKDCDLVRPYKENRFLVDCGALALLLMKISSE